MDHPLIELRHKVQRNTPLIHCIIDPAGANQCADALLAIGAAPILAGHPKEVEEIADMAGALVIDLGNATESGMEAMSHAARAAAKAGVPIVLSLTGIGFSKFRRRFAVNFLEKYPVILIKGNYAELRALADKDYTAAGADAAGDISIDAMTRIARKLAQQGDCMVLASGATDIVTDGESLYHLENGHERLATVTGTGCILGVLCGAYLSQETDIDSPVLACATLGIAGEKAAEAAGKGSGSYLAALLDAFSELTDEELLAKIRMEEEYEQDL